MGRGSYRMGKPRYRLYSVPTPLGATRLVKRISFEDSCRLVSAGVAHQVTQEDGSVYFQYGKPKVAASIDAGSKASCTALSKFETELIAGSGFKGGENLAGVFGKLPDEDLVAEARAKLDAFFPVTRTVAANPLIA